MTASSSVMWSNHFLLFWLALLPIVTTWIGRFPSHSVPAVAYGLVGLVAGMAYPIGVRVIIRVNGAASTLARSVGGATGMVLTLISPWIAHGLCTTSVQWFIHDRRPAVDSRS